MSTSTGIASQIDQRQVYLTLLKKALMRVPLDHNERASAIRFADGQPVLAGEIARWAECCRRMEMVTPGPPDEGISIPETMIGMRRMDNIQECMIDVLRRGVPGDVIETGVWRGGATIFMRGVLEAYGDTSRSVWVADSFQGLPKPDLGAYPKDEGDLHWTYERLAVPLSTVRQNFVRYGLLDDRVKFVPGWFRDTLPAIPIDRLAVLRLDGDMYESTILALRYLYPKVSPGGYVIIDDCPFLPRCTAAVRDYRAEFNIRNKMRRIEQTGIYWQV